MILTELQHYLAQHGKVSLADLALHFRMDPFALRGMLQRPIRKGRVRRLSTSKTCGGCTSCEPEVLEIYEWVGWQPEHQEWAVDASDCPNLSA